MVLTGDVSVPRDPSRCDRFFFLSYARLLFTKANTVSSPERLVVCNFDCALMMSHWQFLMKQRAALDEKWNILDFNEGFWLWAARHMVCTDYKFCLWEYLSYMRCLCSGIETEQNAFFILSFVELKSGITCNNDTAAYVQVWGLFLCFCFIKCRIACLNSMIGHQSINSADLYWTPS